MSLNLEKGSRHIYWLFIAVWDAHIDTAGLISFLMGNNIEASISNIAIHRQPYYLRKYRLADKDYKNSIWAYKHTIVFPFYTKISRSDIDKIRVGFIGYFGDRRKERSG